MKTTNKILLSGVTALALLVMSGCDANDVKNNLENPKVDNPGTDGDVVVQPKPVNSYKRAGWYGKTKVSLDHNGKIYTHETAGVFGELVQSSEGQDQHDIPVFGTGTFQIVFPHDDWADANGDYFSNYKAYDDAKKSWTFQLKAAGVSNDPITINLDELHDVKYKEENGRVVYKESSENNQSRRAELTLVDVDNSTAYTLEELQTTDLKMDNKKTRTFKWVVGPVDASDYEAAIITSQSSARSASRVAPQTFDEATTKTTQGGGKFGLPPM